MSGGEARTIEHIGSDIRTQDGRCTADPIFIVFQKKRVLGFDTNYADDENIVWVDSGNDYVIASPQKHRALERHYALHGKEYGDWTRTAYQWRDQFTTCFFTERGAQEYIARNGHNLTNPHIYADTLYRNEEMKTVRQMLMDCVTDDSKTAVREA